MRIIALRTMAMAAVVALVAFGGCSGDDDPAAPGGGGGGGGGFVLPAGMYNTMATVTTCAGSNLPGGGSLEIWCNNEVIDEIEDFPCEPTVVVPDSLITIDCSGTAVTDYGCTVTYKVTGTGTREDTKWTLGLRLEVTDPGDCYLDSTCVDMVLSAEFITGPPTACAYADVNTFESTVSGGPMDGKVPFSLNSDHNTIPGSGEEWSFWGFYPDFISASPQSAGVGQQWNFGIDLNAIDPQLGPVEIPITIGGGGLKSGGQIRDTAWYGEYDAQTGDMYFSTGGDGTVSVREISNQYIAGTIVLNVQGESYGGPGVASRQITTRTVTGGFYADVRTQQQQQTSQDFASQFGRSMLNSLRRYVE